MRTIVPAADVYGLTPDGSWGVIGQVKPTPTGRAYYAVSAAGYIIGETIHHRDALRAVVRDGQTRVYRGS